MQMKLIVCGLESGIELYNKVRTGGNIKWAFANSLETMCMCIVKQES